MAIGRSATKRINMKLLQLSMFYNTVGGIATYTKNIQMVLTDNIISNMVYALDTFQSRRQSIRNFVKMLRYRPDVIIVHNSRLLYLISLLFKLLAKQTRLYYFVHTPTHNKSRGFRRAYSLVGDMIINATARKIVGVCWFVLAGHKAPDFKKAVLYPNMPPVATRNMYRKPNTELRLISLANFVYSEKVAGVLELIDYFNTFTKLNSMQNISLGLAGTGQFRNLVIARIDAASNRKIALLGSVKLEDVYNYDIIVHDSYLDAFPNVIMEGLAMKIPILLRPVGGSDEVLDEHNSYQFTTYNEFEKSLSILIHDLECGNAKLFSNAAEKYAWNISTIIELTK